MLEKLKKSLHEKSMRLGVGALCAVSAIIPSAFAAEGDAVAGQSPVDIITNAASGLKSDAIKVIGVALGISVTIWGAKMLWNKFRGMSGN